VKTSRNLVLSLEILAAHKLRTLLSMAGIVVGVASVGLVVSAGKGAEKRILDRIRDMARISSSFTPGRHGSLPAAGVSWPR